MKTIVFRSIMLASVIIFMIAGQAVAINDSPIVYEGYLFDNYQELPTPNFWPDPQRTAEAYALLKAVVSGNSAVIPYLAAHIQKGMANSNIPTASRISGANSCLMYANLHDMQNIVLILLWDIRDRQKKVFPGDFFKELWGIDGQYGAFYKHPLFQQIADFTVHPKTANLRHITYALLGGLYNKDPMVRLLCLSALEQIGEHPFMLADVNASMGIETVGNYQQVIPSKGLLMQNSKFYTVIDTNGRLQSLNPFIEINEFRLKIYRITLVKRLEENKLNPLDFKNMDENLFSCLIKPLDKSPYSNETHYGTKEWLNIPINLYLRGYSSYHYLKSKKLVPLGYLPGYYDANLDAFLSGLSGKPATESAASSTSAAASNELDNQMIPSGSSPDDNNILYVGSGAGAINVSVTSESVDVSMTTADNANTETETTLKGNDTVSQPAASDESQTKSLHLESDKVVQTGFRLLLKLFQGGLKNVNYSVQSQTIQFYKSILKAGLINDDNVAYIHSLKNYYANLKQELDAEEVTMSEEEISPEEILDTSESTDNTSMLDDADSYINEEDAEPIAPPMEEARDELINPNLNDLD